MKKRLFVSGSRNKDIRRLKNEEILKEILKADKKIIDKLKKENEELKKESLLLSLDRLEETIKKYIN